MPNSGSAFASLGEVSAEIKRRLRVASGKTKVVVLYAFNTTGKTRLSNVLSEEDEEGDVLKVLCYNALFEDAFTWDNDNYILQFESTHWVAQLVRDQGFELHVAETFQDITGSHIEPTFGFEKGEVFFRVASGEDTTRRS